jgi:hypothetical protein
MNLTEINPSTIEESLKALRVGNPPHPALLDIQWDGKQSLEERRLALEDLVFNTIRDSYLNFRKIEELQPVSPHNRKQALTQVGEDFSSKNGDLQAWSSLYYRYVSPIDLSVEELSTAASVVPQHFRRRINQGLALLSQKIRRMAVQNHSNLAAFTQHLPLPDFTRLVGVKEITGALLSLFKDPHGPRMVSLEGMGGIGKTAIARAFVTTPDNIALWQKILWVSARQTLLADNGELSPSADSIATLEDISARLAEQMGLSASTGKPLDQRLESLRVALYENRCLVVVDNIETVQEYQQLIPALAKMAGTSRFLITTRQTLREYSFIHTLPVQELSGEYAFELIMAEIARRGTPGRLTDSGFQELYQVIGGLPLAIKLVAAQLSLHPLKEILDGFRSAQKGIDGLYRYLYWQTWQSLSEPAKHLLLSFLPANPEGEDLDFLCLMSGQSDTQFFDAMKELDTFSLLEINVDNEPALYRLHRLTVTFLQTDILNLWSGSADELPQPN